MSRLPVLTALILISAFFTATDASAQLAVYKLKFEATGETVNYRSYESGFYVAPITGGTGSLVLTLTTGGVKNYFTYTNFGELFVAVSRADRKTVFSATAANTVSTTTFYAIGNATDQIKIESRAADSKVYVARTLKGYSVSADSERDLPFSSSSTTDVGVAGASHLTASFDEGRTAAANRESRTVAEEIAELESYLESLGFVDGLPATGGGAGGGGTGTTGTATTR